MNSNSILTDIQHVSFDVWNTLVKPNPQYAAARNQYLALLFDMPVDQVKAQYTKTKRFFDNAAETAGASTSIYGVFRRLVRHMDVVMTDYHISEIEKGCHALFRKYPPIVVPGIDDMLMALVNAGYTISIASNTNFISGKLMRQVVFNQLDATFHFQLYSDEIGVSKPHPDFFSSIGIHTTEAQMGLENYGTLPKHILHVGDNLICDVEGATKAGMKALHVTDPDNTVLLLTEALK
jgi:HAD superfamily hydrolase (TIGR01549 family)